LGERSEQTSIADIYDIRSSITILNSA
jgi:hypothetical protein